VTVWFMSNSVCACTYTTHIELSILIRYSFEFVCDCIVYVAQLNCVCVCTYTTQVELSILIRCSFEFVCDCIVYVKLCMCMYIHYTHDSSARAIKYSTYSCQF